jgi:hypothetical protein
MSTISRQQGMIRHERAPGSGASRASKWAIAGGVGTESSQASQGEYELRDVVEPALAKALMLAAEGGHWRIVEQVAVELRARRESRAEGRGEEQTSHGRQGLRVVD